MHVIIQAVVLRVESKASSTYLVYSRTHGKILVHDDRRLVRQIGRLYPGQVAELGLMYRNKQWFVKTAESAAVDRVTPTYDVVVWRGHILDLYATYLFPEMSCVDLFILLAFSMRIQRCPSLLWKSIMCAFFTMQGHQVPDAFLWSHAMLAAHLRGITENGNVLRQMWHSEYEAVQHDYDAWLLEKVQDHERFTALKTHAIVHKLYSNKELLL